MLNILIPNGPSSDILVSCGMPKKKTSSAGNSNFLKDGQMVFSIPVITSVSLQLTMLIQSKNFLRTKNLS